MSVPKMVSVPRTRRKAPASSPKFEAAMIHAARSLAQRMRDESGTEFFEWTDHCIVSQEHEKALREAAEGPMKGILGFCDAPIVSRDVIGDSHSSLVDAGLTMTMGNQAKVISWYDNEWGYSCRVVDLAQKLLP